MEVVKSSITRRLKIGDNSDGCLWKCLFKIPKWPPLSDSIDDDDDMADDGSTTFVQLLDWDQESGKGLLLKFVFGGDSTLPVYTISNQMPHPIEVDLRLHKIDGATGAIMESIPENRPFQTFQVFKATTSRFHGK